MKSKIVTALIAITLSTNLWSSTTFATVNCGDWVKNPYDFYKVALISYLSGLAKMHELAGNTDDPLRNLTSTNQAILWMDKFCQKNPLQNIQYGAVDLFIEPKKMK